mgnify:CR=1 FL=1
MANTKKTEHGERFDTETGEIIEDKSTNNKSTPYNHDGSNDERLIRSGFYKLFKGGINKILKGTKHDGTVKLFMFLIYNLGDKNFVNLKQQHIADTLGVRRRTVSRYMQDMEDQDIVVYGRGWCLVNPNIIWYGAYEREREMAVKMYYKKRYNKRTAKDYGKEEK